MPLTYGKIPVPKLKILTDPTVPGNTTLSGGINSGLYQDPGVPGQVLGDYSPPPTSYGGVPLDPGFTGGSAPGIGTVPASGSGGGDGSGGFDPNKYLQEIFGDPVYKSALTNYNAALSQGRASLDDQIRRAVIASGYDPRGQMTGSLADYASALDDATMQAAGQNQMSTKAQIQNQLDKGLSGLNYALAARGALQSGAQATGAGQLNQAATQQGYQSMQSLIDAISGGAANYGQYQSDQATQLQNAREAVATRLAGLQGYSGPGTTDGSGGTTDGTGSTGTTGGAAPPAGGGMVSWMGKTFTTKAGLSAYLAKTAGGYSNFADWARDHPSAAARLS